ncbi:MAG: hypothetical protein MZW92_40655 [Comamonadaceae bacterium]|nr:hypothetical protein [Comamonadaceae bacterium]
MDRIIKVFCSRAEQAELAKLHRVIERYPAFVLLQVPARTAQTIARQYPVEEHHRALRSRPASAASTPRARA